MKYYKAYDENLTVLGMSGSGKTTWVKNFLYNLRQYGIRYLVWDVNRQYSKVGLLWNGRTPIPNQAIYYPTLGDYKELDTILSKLPPNYILVLEESHEYTTKHSILSKWLEWTIRVGRNYGRTYIAVSQRPADLHNSILSNSHHIISFRLTLPRDIRFMREWLGDDAYKLKTIPKYHYLYKYYMDDKVVYHEPITPKI